MSDWDWDLNNIMRFDRIGDFYFCKMRTIIIKDIEKKSKNKNKKVKSKVINCLLIFIFVFFCSNKTI